MNGAIVSGPTGAFDGIASVSSIEQSQASDFHRPDESANSKLPVVLNPTHLNLYRRSPLKRKDDRLANDGDRAARRAVHAELRLA